MAQITFTIPDNKLTEFKEGFLEHCPVPVEGGIPAMSEAQWIKEWGKQQYINAYTNGKHTLAMRSEVVDNQIVE